jgi:hypothetical protein
VATVVRKGNYVWGCGMLRRGLSPANHCGAEPYISPIDEPSKSFEAGKFFEDSTNPLEKRDFKEIERRWLSIARGCKCNSKEARKPSKRRLTLLVVSRDDANAVFSSVSLYYAPHLQL